MRDNKFLKIFFRFLIVILFNTHFMLASNQILNTSPIYKSLLNIPEKKLSVEHIIAKLKNGKALSIYDKKISDKELIESHENCPPQDLDYWIFIIRDLKKKVLFPDLRNIVISRGQDEHASAMAQTNLGVLYKTESVFPDKKSSEYFKKAIQQGSIHAEFLISDLYESGWISYEPGEKNYLEQAAEKGYAPAQSRLGKSLIKQSNFDDYRNDPRYQKGKELLELAVAQGDSSALRELGLHYRAEIRRINACNQTNKDEKEAQISKIEAKYIDFLTPAGYQGDRNAQFELGKLYQLQKNYSEAFKWFNAAAAQGNIRSKKILVDLYWNGIGVEKDEVQSLKILYELVQKHNNAKAQFRISEICEEGRLIPKDDIAIVLTRMSILKGKLKEEQVKKIRSYLSNKWQYVETQQYDDEFNLNEVIPYSKKIMEFWDNCPNLNFVQSLMNLHRISTPDILKHLGVLHKSKNDFMNAFSGFHQGDFMVSCVKSKDPILEKQMRTSKLIRSWSYDSTNYYTFNSRYVQKVDLMMAFLDSNAPWRKSKDYLLKWYQDLPHQGQSSKTSNDNSEDKVNLTDDDCYFILHKNIEFLQNLDFVPKDFLELLKRSTPERNKNFKKNYPYFEQETTSKNLSSIDVVVPVTKNQSNSGFETENKPGVEVFMIKNHVTVPSTQLTQLMKNLEEEK